jgi:hypothetical protein
LNSRTTVLPPGNVSCRLKALARYNEKIRVRMHCGFVSRFVAVLENTDALILNDFVFVRIGLRWVLSPNHLKGQKDEEQAQKH